LDSFSWVFHADALASSWRHQEVCHFDFGLLRDVSLFMLGSDLSLNSIGRYENSADSSQWIEFKSGSFPSGTASLYTPANAARTQFHQEIIEYQREGRRISFQTSAGSRTFEVQGNKLIDSNGVVWARKYSND
jgi:hypothetical protein